MVSGLPQAKMSQYLFDDVFIGNMGGQLGECSHPAYRRGQSKASNVLVVSPSFDS